MNRFLSQKDMSGNGLLSMLELKLHLKKLPIFGDILF